MTTRTYTIGRIAIDEPKTTWPTSDSLQANTASVSDGGGVKVTYAIGYDSEADSNVATTDSGSKGTFVVNTVNLSFAKAIASDGTVSVVLSDTNDGKPLGGILTQPVKAGDTTVAISVPAGTTINVENVHQVSVAVNGTPATIESTTTAPAQG